MTEVTFGDDLQYAVLFYDRGTRVCIIVANSSTYLPDAFAVVNSMKMDARDVLVVAPRGTELYYEQLVQKDTGFQVYGYKR
jgi:hypothetical protein